MHVRDGLCSVLDLFLRRRSHGGQYPQDGGGTECRPSRPCGQPFASSPGAYSSVPRAGSTAWTGRARPPPSLVSPAPCPWSCCRRSFRTPTRAPTWGAGVLGAPYLWCASFSASAPHGLAAAFVSSLTSPSSAPPQAPAERSWGKD